MKTILLSISLLIASISMAQNLSLTGNISLGSNCGNGPHLTFTYQDINLNGYKIDLRNATLSATNNLNGPGEITKCGNQNNSSVCISGSTQNNPILNGLNCQTLSSQEFVLTDETLGLEYEVFDLIGRSIKKGTTSYSMYDTFYNQILIVKVDGFKPFKIIK